MTDTSDLYNSEIQHALDSLVEVMAALVDDSARLGQNTPYVFDDPTLTEASRQYLAKAILDTLIYKTNSNVRWLVTKEADIVSEMTDLIEQPGEWTNYKEESLERKTQYLHQLGLRRQGMSIILENAKLQFKEKTGAVWMASTDAAKARTNQRTTASMEAAQRMIAARKGGLAGWN